MTISEIEAAIFHGGVGTPAYGLAPSATPDPYIAPQFEIIAGELNSEVIIIQAPAAVGKSVTAQHLSAETQSRFLNLATTRASSFALRGAVDEAAFHEGKCPIIVDALDEGALFSGEDNRDAFLSTSRDFMLEDRSVQNRVKVVFLGRPESADWAGMILADGDAHSPVTICRIRVSYFDSDSSKELIRLYSRAEVDRLFLKGEIDERKYRRLITQIEGRQMAEVIEKYFSLLEDALQLDRGNLWTDAVGRSFAGYAPTLAAIGSLLAPVENPYRLLQELKMDQPNHTAWDIIDQVTKEILVREQQEKILPPIRNAATGNVPRDAYNEGEQVEYLSQVIMNGQFQIIWPGDLENAFEKPSDFERYREVVTQQLPQHPLLKDCDAANDVLGSKILCAAICSGSRTLYGAVNGGPENGLMDLMEVAARQPFLWRFFEVQTRSEGGIGLLDGVYLGYVVSSYYNAHELSRARGPLTLKNDGDEGIRVRLAGVTFSVVPPIRLYGEVADCEMQCEDAELQIVGMGDSRFVFRGMNTIVAKRVEFKCDGIRVSSGSLWLDPKDPDNSWPANFPIGVERDPSNQTRWGWGTHLREKFPWSTQPSTMVDPAKESRAVRMVRELRGTDIVVVDDFGAPEQDVSMRVLHDRYGDDLRTFLRSLVQCLSTEGVRRIEQTTRGPEQKFRILVHTWEKLETACRSPQQAEGPYKEFVESIGNLVEVQD